MSILIVGGSGFLGDRLIQLAHAAGQSVAATYASRPGSAGVR
jgi:dTDP-4-dehydrorhamnose reductase